jgi:hypothetical protein
VASAAASGNDARVKILISGASGFVGSALSSALRADGNALTPLVRRTPRAGEAGWDPAAGRIDDPALEGHGIAVHLAGENIARGRWTAAHKARIRASRVDGTRLLCEALARLSRPPRQLVCASAIGYYGDRGDEILTEDSAPGDDFLAGVVRDWEAAAQPARDAGIAVVHLRIGVVLGRDGGALGRMLTPFRLGLGGRLGSGAQYMSWITRSDLVNIVRWIASDPERDGVWNATAPAPITNREFTRALGKVLRRPTPLPVPAFALRLLLGEMADALLLSSTRVVPSRLQAAGFRFEHEGIEPALRSALGQPG